MTKTFEITFNGSEEEVNVASEALHKYLAEYSPEFVTVNNITQVAPQSVAA